MTLAELAVAYPLGTHYTIDGHLWRIVGYSPLTNCVLLECDHHAEWYSVDQLPAATVRRTVGL